MRLIVDKREQDQEILNLLLERSEDQRDPFDFEFAINPVGDFIWRYDDGMDTGICIEAKGAQTDLISSILTGHLDTQLIDLAQYTHPFLLLWGEFNWFKDRQRFNRQRFLAYWSSVAIRHPVKPMWFPRKSDFVEFIAALPHQIGKGDKLQVMGIRHKGTLSRLDPNIGQFYSLPSIGEKRADELSKRFSSFWEFLNDVRDGRVEGLPMATYEYLSPILGMDIRRLLPLKLQLLEVPGIGSATADKICETYHTWEEFYYGACKGEIKINQKIMESVTRYDTARSLQIQKASA